MKLKIEYLHEGMDKLKHSYDYDAGYDVPMYKDTLIHHGKNILGLGFKLILPPGQVGFLSLRSSIMGNGCICNHVPFDSNYSGEWNMILYNVDKEFTVKKGERICQLLVHPITYLELVEEDVTIRGNNGLGSTGRGSV